MSKFRICILVSTLMAIPTLAGADDPPDGGEHHHGPPSEALAACKDKKEGDACSFEGHHGPMSGTCHAMRSGDLVCMPPHHHHHEGDGGT
jgi:hypothetical protein